MEMKKCCFTGHRPQNFPFGFNEEHYACIKIKKQLEKMIVGLIEKKNITHFLSGAALGVNMWAMEIVIDLKEDYPNITLEAVLPCRNQTSGWNVKSKDRYDRLLAQCDKVTIMQEEYTNDCIIKRNKYMIDTSDCVVAVWGGQPGGTANTIKYAQTKKKPVYCINSRTFKMYAL